jgi:hypothetical protein
MWSKSFADELGVVTQEIVENYYDFAMSGAAIRVDEFTRVGGLKPSIKMTFWYEFLLRASYNGANAFVIPKTGYTHTINRTGSLIEEWVKIDEKEKLFWFDLAKKEYFFKNERVEKSKYEIKITK